LPTIRVFVPLHVSGIWVAHYSSDPLRTGSTGAGLNISSYLVSEVRPGPCRVVLNEREVLREPSLRACREAGVSVETRAASPVELGKGFGLSAALLMSHCIGLYVLAEKPLTKALQLAHVLEVEHGTGLGDVVAEWIGGFEVRVEPGAPGVGRAYRIIPRTRVDLVVAELGGFESTASMLSRIPPEVYRLGSELLERVVETEDLQVFFESARRFTSMVFDYAEARRALEGAKGVVGYYLKKSALVVWAERDRVLDVLEALWKAGIKAKWATISPMGVSVVYPAQPPQKGEPADKGKAS
jgi:pantoate kinase